MSMSMFIIVVVVVVVVVNNGNRRNTISFFQHKTGTCTLFKNVNYPKKAYCTVRAKEAYLLHEIWNCESRYSIRTLWSLKKGIIPL